MSDSPYVWKHRDGKHVVIGVRQFDGIDHPNYDALHSLTPDEARYIANECWRLAESIDGKTKKQSALKKIRSNTKRIAAQAKADAEI